MKPSNKYERRLISLSKYKRRTWWNRKWIQQRHGGVLPWYITKESLQEPYGFLSCTRPCSCWACKKPRYKRNKDDFII